MNHKTGAIPVGWMHHLDVPTKGDRDGYPTCLNEPTGTCLVGGGRPAPFIDERGT